MKTQYYVASSLDGYIADEEHSLDWLFQFAVGDDYTAFFADVGAVAMGSATYEWILAHQSGPESGSPVAWPYEQPSWVFTSQSLPEVPGADLRFVSGDIGTAYAQMESAAGGKNLWIVGGGDLAGQFYDKGLLDEMIVTVAPVTLGGGFPLLPRRITSPPLRLLEVGRYGEAGMVQLRYAVPQDGAQRAVER
jgi:dihydrofolate reductase